MLDISINLQIVIKMYINKKSYNSHTVIVKIIIAILNNNKLKVNKIFLKVNNII